MPNGTASARLKKMILFSLLKRLNEDTCFRCGLKILNIDELSVEHKEPWLDSDVALFWDLNNIAFSHLSCNVRLSRQKPKKGKAVRRLTLDGKMVAEYRSMYEASKKTGINRAHISRLCAGRQYTNGYGLPFTPESAGGYKWELVE